MPRAVVAGHICVDLVPTLRGDEVLRPGRLTDVGPLAIRPGGCVANTGLILAALGVDVTVVADIGADLLGEALRAALRAGGVSDAGLRTVPTAQTSYSIVFDWRGSDRALWHHEGANADFDGTRADLSGADLLHVGYPTALPALHADGGAPLRRLLRRAKERGLTTSVDLSTVDPESSAGRLDWTALLARALPLVDVFTPSVDDLRLAMKLSAADQKTVDLGRRMVELGAAVVLLTDGARGMHLFTADRSRLLDAGRLFGGRHDQWADQTLFAAPEPIGEAVGTTGAGDAAAAGLLWAILSGAAPREAIGGATNAAARQIAGLTRNDRPDGQAEG